MLNVNQFRDLIDRVLRDIELHSLDARELLVMTAAVESKLGTYIRQINGPALGVFQMEPTTHDDIWDNWLVYKNDLADLINYVVVLDPVAPIMEWDLRYAIIMARLHYLRVPQPLPPRSDVLGMAQYWKDHYNTHLGAGTVEKAIEAYNSCTGGV